jgi:hypothetical protein
VPKWIIEKFMALELPEDVATEIGQQLTMETKRKILGENAARLYNINIEERSKKLGLAAPAKVEVPAASLAVA